MARLDDIRDSLRTRTITTYAGLTTDGAQGFSTLGTPDVMAAVADLERRGVEFLATEQVHSSERGALTKPLLGSVMFELVKSPAEEPAPQR